jgi:hypothetical protein
VNIDINPKDKRPIPRLKPYLGKWVFVTQDPHESKWIAHLNNAREGLYKYRFDETSELDEILFDSEYGK